MNSYPLPNPLIRRGTAELLDLSRITPATPRFQPRPIIGVALSAGGARGLAHVGVIQVLEENGIPVFEDPPLARSMFAQVSVDSVIPPVFYKAVAELIHRVYAASPQTRRVN